MGKWPMQVSRGAKIGIFDRKPNIGKMKAKKDVQGLIKALKHKDNNIRWEAAEALGKTKDARAVEPLNNALKDEEESVRKVAKKALGKIEVKKKSTVKPDLEKLREKKEREEADRLVAELIENGRSEGFLSMPPKSGIWGRCGSKVVEKGRKVKCTYCGLEQNYDHFNETHKHIRDREIGIRLNEMGGTKLMQAACHEVRTDLSAGPGRELEAAWAYIGGGCHSALFN